MKEKRRRRSSRSFRVKRREREDDTEEEEGKVELKVLGEKVLGEGERRSRSTWPRETTS